MLDENDVRLDWTTLDDLVLSGQKIEFVRRVQEATSSGLHEALDLLVRRYAGEVFAPDALPLQVATVRYESGPLRMRGGDADDCLRERFSEAGMSPPAGWNDPGADHSVRKELTAYGVWPIVGRFRVGLGGGDLEPREARHHVLRGCSTVFADPLAIDLDDGFAVGTMVAIGMSLRARVLCVVHVERGDRDRIISARRATAGEREVYEGGDRT